MLVQHMNNIPYSSATKMQYITIRSKSNLYVAVIAFLPLMLCYLDLTKKMKPVMCFRQTSIRPLTSFICLIHSLHAQTMSVVSVASCNLSSQTQIPVENLMTLFRSGCHERFGVMSQRPITLFTTWPLINVAFEDKGRAIVN